MILYLGSPIHPGEIAVELNTRAHFPMSDDLRKKYVAKGILIEDQPDTFVRPMFDDEEFV